LRNAVLGEQRTPASRTIKEEPGVERDLVDETPTADTVSHHDGGRPVDRYGRPLDEEQAARYLTRTRDRVQYPSDLKGRRKPGVYSITVPITTSSEEDSAPTQSEDGENPAPEGETKEVAKLNRPSTPPPPEGDTKEVAKSNRPSTPPPGQQRSAEPSKGPQSAVSRPRRFLLDDDDEPPKQGATEATPKAPRNSTPPPDADQSVTHSA
jgi:hypothetical protein